MVNLNIVNFFWALREWNIYYQNFDCIWNTKGIFIYNCLYKTIICLFGKCLDPFLMIRLIWIIYTKNLQFILTMKSLFNHVFRLFLMIPVVIVENSIKYQKKNEVWYKEQYPHDGALICVILFIKISPWQKPFIRTRVKYICSIGWIIFRGKNRLYNNCPIVE